MKCPKCAGAQLVPLEVGEIMLDRCAECAGIWFDHGELEAVLGTTGASRFDPVDPEPGEPPPGLCPRCAVEMRAVVAAQDPARPVRVDRCPSCMGLWLDRTRLALVEDQRIPLAAHELFVDPAADEATVATLHEAEQDIVRKAAELIKDHPQRTSLLAFMERAQPEPAED